MKCIECKGDMSAKFHVCHTCHEAMQKVVETLTLTAKFRREELDALDKVTSTDIELLSKQKTSLQENEKEPRGQRQG